MRHSVLAALPRPGRLWKFCVASCACKPASTARCRESPPALLLLLLLLPPPPPQILLRRTKNNPVLIGDPGVGKTAVAEGIAQLLAGAGREAGLHVALPPGLRGRRCGLRAGFRVMGLPPSLLPCPVVV